MGVLPTTAREVTRRRSSPWRLASSANPSAMAPTTWALKARAVSGDSWAATRRVKTSAPKLTWGLRPRSRDRRSPSVRFRSTRRILVVPRSTATPRGLLTSGRPATGGGAGGQAEPGKSSQERPCHLLGGAGEPPGAAPGPDAGGLGGGAH